MHEIYRQANQIFVDLGDPLEGGRLVVDLIRKAARAFDRGPTLQQSGASQSGSIHHNRPLRTEVSLEKGLALIRFPELQW